MCTRATFSFVSASNSDGKASACNAGEPGSIPGLGRSSGEENCNPLQYFLPGESHGQRSLVDYSSWGCRVGHDWATHTHSAMWAFLTTGSNVRLWGLFVLGKCVFATPYWPPSKKVSDRSVDWCVSVYSICVTGILVALCKMEIQVQFIKKTFTWKIVTKERWFFFFWSCMAKVFFRLQRR